MDKLRLDLDFSKDPIAQDMICRIMRDKGFQTPQEAVQYGVNSDTATDIIENRWHADPERELHWIPLAEPKFIVEIDEYQQACLNLAECIEKVSSQEAVGLLLMFALGRMGYHL